MFAETNNRQGREATLYTTPVAEVLKLEEQDMLCISTPNGTEPYNLDNWL